MSIRSKPEFHPKGWGSEHWIVNNDQYCGKLMTVLKDKKCSIHYHVDKLEHFYITKGRILLEHMENAEHPLDTAATLTRWETHKQQKVLVVGDVVEIPRFHLHRFIGLEDQNEFIEISTTHREEDSHRVLKGD